MAGSHLGGLKTAKKNLKNNPNFYREIGRIGGKKGGKNKGFASKKVGKDGMTGPERAKIAGIIGGTVSRRRPRPEADCGDA